MGEVSLVVDDRVFVAKKSILCEYSDYFRAMFSGAYVEGELEEIKINMIEADSMEILLRYMEMGFIDLSEFSLSKIGDIAFGANFLQITELNKQIEYTLDEQTSITNWIETMNIAEAVNYSKLERNCTAFGLLSFKGMKPENVSTIYRLSWILSHPYLNAPSEFHVFKFGFDWIIHMETGADALLIILGCLDFQRITEDDLRKIQALIKDYEHSLAAKVVDCLYNFAMEGKDLSRINIVNHRRVLCEEFTERVYQEVLSIVTDSTERILSFTPVVPMWVVKDTKPEVVPHHLYTFNKDKGFEKWLEVADKNLWGWSVVSWGPTKIVVLGGEYGRGTGNFMTDIRVYNILKKEWTQHGVKLPQRRHAGVVIVDDSLYIVGGVGGFRVMLDTSIVYDLNNRTHRSIARLPNIIQNPAVCVHNGTVLAAGHRNVYRYETYEQTDNWNILLEIEIRCNFMTSFNGYIYCSQNYFNHLYRFKPDVDTKIEIITVLTHPPASICNLGDCLLVFTASMCGGSKTVEEYDGISDKPRILWGVKDSDFMYNDVAGVCHIVMDMPNLNRPLTDYIKKYVMRYTDS